VLQYFLPIRRILEPPEVRLRLAGQDAQGSGLADAVGADEAEHLTWPRNGQPVELESVRAIAVSRLLVQVLGQVDDGNGLEGALFRADSATDAQRLGDPSDLGILLSLDAQLPCAHHGAKLFALLLALFRFAAVRIDNRDAQPLVVRLLFLRLLAHCACAADLTMSCVGWVAQGA
jgi:hypothetical protein